MRLKALETLLEVNPKLVVLYGQMVPTCDTLVSNPPDHTRRAKARGRDFFDLPDLAVGGSVPSSRAHTTSGISR